MKLRCTLDGLLLPAELEPETAALVAYDGDEPFVLEALEAMYYELVSATREQVLRLERACRYRFLRRAEDFEIVEE